MACREDLDGYEYRESEEERNFRFIKQLEYQERLQLEVERREENPTELEQVEDVLYAIVDTICIAEEELIAERKAHRKKEMQQSWNLATRGYPMKHLKENELESGEKTRVVSNFDFNNILISETGHMVAVTTPPGLFELHEQEREVLREIQRKKQEWEEYERRRPFVDKLRIAMIHANNGK